MTRRRPSKSGLPEQFANAIRKAWPDGIIDFPADMDDAPTGTCIRSCRRVCRAFGEPPSPMSASLMEDRNGAKPQTRRRTLQTGMKNRVPTICSSYRYWMTGFGSRPTRSNPIRKASNSGFKVRAGSALPVGISLIAPFAVVTLDEMGVFENGSRSEPDVEPHIFGVDGRKLNVEEHYREMVDDQGLAVLRKLRVEIVRILNDFEIAVIPEEDQDKPVPWLRAGEEVLAGRADEPITVRQAFFFHRL